MYLNQKYLSLLRSLRPPPWRGGYPLPPNYQQRYKYREPSNSRAQTQTATISQLYSTQPFGNPPTSSSGQPERQAQSGHSDKQSEGQTPSKNYPPSIYN